MGMPSLTIGLVFETFETYSREAADPVDAHVEFEPESTIEALEAAIVFLGHRPQRLGSPSALLESHAKGGLVGIVTSLDIVRIVAGYARAEAPQST